MGLYPIMTDSKQRAGLALCAGSCLTILQADLRLDGSFHLLLGCCTKTRKARNDCSRNSKVSPRQATKQQVQLGPANLSFRAARPGHRL